MTCGTWLSDRKEDKGYPLTSTIHHAEATYVADAAINRPN